MRFSLYQVLLLLANCSILNKKKKIYFVAIVTSLYLLASSCHCIAKNKGHCLVKLSIYLGIIMQSLGYNMYLAYCKQK